jgi:hypothetical protein
MGGTEHVEVKEGNGNAKVHAGELDPCIIFFLIATLFVIDGALNCM